MSARDSAQSTGHDVKSTIGPSVVSVVLWRGQLVAALEQVEDGRKIQDGCGQDFFSGFWWCHSPGAAEPA